MVDYCMCKNENCSKKMCCYRYRAIPDEYAQAYFKDLTEDECEKKKYFLRWVIDEEKTSNRDSKK